MKKKIKLILFTIVLCFISMVFVEAKETIMTCEYFKAYDTLSGSPQAGVLCNIYSDYSHQCYMEVGSDTATTKSNKEKIKNWGTAFGLTWKAKDYVQNNNKCPDYLLLKVGKGINGYEIHAAENMSDLLALNGKLKGQRYPATLKGIKISDEDRKKAEDEIKFYTDSINSTVSNYSIKSCASEDKIITKYSKCKDIISNLKSNIATWDNNVYNYVHKGYFKEEEDIIQNYRNAVKNAENFFIEAEKELEEKNKEIENELGIGDNEENKDDSQDDNQNENNNKTNVNITKFCHDKNVKKALKFIGYVLIIVKIIVPCLLIIFGVIDFAKAVISSSEDSIKKSVNSLLFRFIAAIIIFILPTVINFTFEKIVKNNSNYSQCRICVFNPKRC